MADGFGRKGWRRFAFDPALAEWAAYADNAARGAEVDPQNAEWLRCGGTWFVGVDALPNDGAGRLPGGPALAGEAFDAARKTCDAPLHRGQASVCYPGYPLQGDDESEAAYRFRQSRDAAHVDGLHRIMPGRRRLLKERHAYILGLPLNEASALAAPMVVWEGSHEIMRAALIEAYAGCDPSEWDQVDVTEPYQAARNLCFAQCNRVEVHAQPGEAYMVHRLALHGVAPWRGGDAQRRAVAYFRPDPGDVSDWWLLAP